ncbi:MAG: methyltransferase protein [Gammaproteobacteria bacterium]|nr:methyltransferase protein [Gammaproteobacteria bacterium]
MKSSETDYTGRDNLQVMQEAVNYNRWLCNLVGKRATAGCHMLDFGAGSGTYAKMLTDDGFHIHCIEPDEPLRELLTSAGLSVTDSITGVAADSIDFIYTLNVLEHIKDDRRMLTELLRPLRTGGTLLVYVPAFQMLFSSMDTKVGHYRRYRLNALVKMMRSSGLQVTYARYCDSLGFLATLLYKLLGSREGALNPSAVRLYDRVAFPVSRLLDRFVGYLFGKNVVVVATKT